VVGKVFDFEVTEMDTAVVGLVMDPDTAAHTVDSIVEEVQYWMELAAVAGTVVNSLPGVGLAYVVLASLESQKLRDIVDPQHPPMHPMAILVIYLLRLVEVV
jgi:hypothetical protein